MRAMQALPANCKLKIFRRCEDDDLKFLAAGCWYEDRVLNAFSDFTHSMVTVRREGDTATVIIEKEKG